MKAVVLTGFGHADQVLRYETQHPKPQRKAGEVLVEVHVASVNGGDSRVRMVRGPLAWAAGGVLHGRSTLLGAGRC